MPFISAARRSDCESWIACAPSVVLITNSISWLSIASTQCGRPSSTLLMPVARQARGAQHAGGAVRRDEREPEVDEPPRDLDDRRLVDLAHARNATPPVGSFMPAASWLFANARAKSRSMPMTSPVERISGPRIVSTPANFANGNTPSLTDTWRGSISPSERRARRASCRPSPSPRSSRAARRSPCDTNGTVRDARGLTSST